MAQDGYWSLFWQTGLPQAYLALRGEREDRARPGGGEEPPPPRGPAAGGASGGRHHVIG